ncbi:hypothetical protein [Silvimonas sp.]|uniref:ParB/RepB/Spo0J family partition protein n=1 Tax=Silvimonas sp. TaxID=2650811 RepID=UPI002849DF05|nr:hypothetical protein [Silvimonas sp.]MDR3427788.1 hypothetical protein [Silvimonas sp.]
MADLKSMAESRGALLNFDPRLIQVKPGLNVRDLTDPKNREHIEYLKASIRENGFLKSHPLEIFQEAGTVFVAAGHCRLTAVLELLGEGVEIVTVPCVPEERGINDVDRILRQSTSNSGKRLTMLEEASNIQRLMGFGLSVAEIGRRMGKSAGYISQLLDFKAASPEVHQLVREGKVSATFAAETVRDHKGEGVAILKDAVKTAEARGAAKATKKDSVIHVPKPKMSTLVELLRVCRTRLTKHNEMDVVRSIDIALKPLED